jgi:hypothetical protein
VSIRARRPTPRRRAAPRWTPEEWNTATLALLRRSGGRCEHCGQDLHGRAERHHRSRRRDGGDRLSNLLLLLPEHHHWITSHPEAAVRNGWIVQTWDDPEEVPVNHRGTEWSLLDDEGGRVRTPPPVSL